MTTDPATHDYILSQTMLRIKDPEASVPFYRDVLGMTLIDRFDFAAGKFSLYFLGYPAEPIPEEPAARAEWLFSQPALLELTHNWGTETDLAFDYHNGNTEPRGFGHIGVTVPDVHAACRRFGEMGVDFVKKPDDGVMKGLAFIRDPDGYWIEILSARGLGAMITASQAAAA